MIDLIYEIWNENGKYVNDTTTRLKEQTTAERFQCLLHVQQQVLHIYLGRTCFMPSHRAES